jgi:hypothetical protein
MADNWVGIVNSTRAKFTRGASDLTLRSRYLLARMKQKGRITYNNSGTELKWQVEFSQPQVRAYANGGAIDYQAHDAFRQLSMPWRGYYVPDSMTMMDKEMNKGDEALIKLFQTKANRLNKSLSNAFPGEMLKDGSAAGRENNIHGAKTFLGTGTTVAADRIAKPDDTYGGYDTDVGANGGSWSADLGTSPNANIARDWPDGNGDPEYDFLSPKIGNWSSTSWGTGSTSWEDNCWRVISQMITWLTTTGGDGGMPDVCLLASDLYQGYKNHEEAIRRINVPHKGAMDLGFQALNQDGVAIMSDFDVPATEGFFFNTSEIEIASLTDQLFWTKDVEWDPHTLSHLWVQGFFGNVKWQPKYVGHINNVA